MSIMNVTRDMPNPPLAWTGAEPVTQVAAQASLRPWGFWASLGWGLFALVTAVFAIVVCTMVWMLAHQFRIPTATDAGFGTLAGALAPVAAIVVLAIAVKCRRQSLRDYFALNAMHWREVLIGVAALLAVIVVSEIAERLLGIDAGSKATAQAYREAKLASALPMLLFGVLIVAPITEELMFRGFLHRGWTASRLGVVGTIVLSSALWTVLHQQYNAYGLLCVFVLGLVLGWIRQRSASTTPAIILHALNNLAATAFVVIQVEWLT